MRRFVVAAALAASLLSASPSQAIPISSADYFEGITVYGAIPEPININVYLSFDVSSPPGGSTPYDAYLVIGFVATQHSYVQVCSQRTATGTRSCGSDGRLDFFTLTDTDRHIDMGAGGYTTGGYIFNSASISFYLPDTLSIATPVPEPSSWALMILGFAGIALIRRYRPSRGSTAPSL
jgi:hypothetical protein